MKTFFRARRTREKQIRREAVAPHLTLETLPATVGLGFRLGLAETRDAVAVFALTAFFQQFRAFKTFQHVPFSTQSGGRAQTRML